MAERRVGVLGASGLVGQCLLPMLKGEGWQVVGFSRRRMDAPIGGEAAPQPLPFWVSLVPIHVLPAFAPLLERHGVRRIVALSSTSRFSKRDSADRGERETALRLAEGEAWLSAWGAAKHVEWVVLRPTLIYGEGRDRNVSEIAGFIRRFGFFPILGEASGMRQPVHVEDVARACMAALETPEAARRSYDLSGGETLSYRDMVCRIFAALGRKPRLLAVPLRLFALAVSFVRLVPRYRHWRGTMAERMNSDLVFDNAAAARDLGFAPRAFDPALPATYMTDGTAVASTDSSNRCQG